MTVPAEIIRNIHDIKPLSDSAFRLMAAVNIPEHTVYDVIRIVENDAVLTAHVLRVVNSAAMGLRSHVTSVSRAVSYLGDKMIVGLALGVCASHVFNDPLAGYEGESGDLWRHSIRVAVAAREISLHAIEKIALDYVYTAGIMHDIGKAAISSYLTGKTKTMVAETESGQKSDYLQAEQDALGTDHCEVGAYLAEYWQVPSPLPEIIAFHHRPAQAPDAQKPMAYLIHLADFVAMMGGSSSGADAFLYRLDENYKKYISLSAMDFEKVVYQTGQEYDKMITALFGHKEVKT